LFDRFDATCQRSNSFAHHERPTLLRLRYSQLLLTGPIAEAATLSSKTAEYKRLVRLVGRAFYGDHVPPLQPGEKVPKARETRQ